ncbi:MAG: VCBS repeat-containing protein [Polyangiales bacterium]
MPEGMTRARVTLARDRALTREVRSTVVEGARWRPTETLPHAVWFWRVEALAADNRVVWTSATWEFQSPWRDTAVDSSWGPIWDTNGDGYDDLVLSSVNGLFVVQGASSFNSVTFRALMPAVSTTTSAAVGDFNGDGIADVAVPGTARDGTQRAEVWVYYGDVVGLASSPSTRLTQPSERRLGVIWGAAVSAADWNGDGYSDLIISHTCVAEDGCREDLPYLLEIFAGSPLGVSVDASVRLRDERAVLALSYRSLGDINDDGYGDVVGLVGPESSSTGNLIFGAPASVHGGVRGQVDIAPMSSYFAGKRKSVGDVDGDGQIDLLIGGNDMATLFGGGSEVHSSILSQVGAPDRPTSYGPGDFGYFIGCAGDLDGDGRSDVLLASPQVPLGENFDYGPGRLYIYRGTVDGISNTPTQVLSGTERHQGFGRASVGCVDLDGDGRAELYIRDMSSYQAPLGYRFDSEWNFTPVSLPLPSPAAMYYGMFEDLALRLKPDRWRG